MILPYIYDRGFQEWYENGRRPTYKRSNIKWFVDHTRIGKLHRFGGPAGISENGTQYYYYDGYIKGIFQSDNQPQTFHTRKHHPTEGTAI